VLLNNIHVTVVIVLQSEKIVTFFPSIVINYMVNTKKRWRIGRVTRNAIFSLLALCYMSCLLNY